MAEKPTYKTLEKRIKQLEKENNRLLRIQGKIYKSEEALKAERDRSQQLLDIAGVIFVSIDLNQNVTLINKKGCEILGYEEKEIIGKNWFDHFIKNENGKSIKDVFNQIIHGDIKPVEYYENSVITKDGQEKVIAWQNSMIRDRSGRIIGTLSSGIDITDRKKVEEQLRQSQKMEAVGTLAGGIAHDFNNMLSVVIGNIELAMDEMPDESSVQYYLKSIMTASLRAKDMVDQLLSFSRKNNLERKPLNFVSAIKGALKLLRSSIPTNIEFRLDIPDFSYIILADLTQMNQVMINLCTNAAYAMQETGGTLSVGIEDVILGDMSAISTSDLTPGRYVRLRVRDTGCGIDPDIQDRIFDPYFTTKDVGKGSGMGLAVVHGIIKDHGGEINVRSKKGEGAVFEIYLPLINSDLILPGEEAVSGTIPGGHERILLVDDEEMVLEMMQLMIVNLGYHVTAKTSSIDALSLFSLQPDQYDLVITDMTMPKLTGDKLAEELLKIRNDIPIILCTGFSEKISQDKSKAIGIRELIMKPLVMRELAGTIRKVLDTGFVEHRRNKRIQISAAAIVKSVSGPLIHGKLVDISRCGLAFCYKTHEHPISLKDGANLIIDISQNNFTLGNIPCKIISDLSLSNDSLPRPEWRRCSLRFESANAGQIDQVGRFIEVCLT